MTDPTVPSSPTPRRVLIVDDDVDLRTVIAEVLVDNGWHVRSAADGIDALTVLGAWLPDVMLVDLMMPRMDGRALCAEVARMGRTADIPMVLTSAGAVVHREAAALDVVAALAKPFELDDLVSCLTTAAGR